MTRLTQLVKGLGALCVLVGLVAGVPWALVHFVGWPLPHHVPTAAELGQALERQGIPAQTLVDALAVVVWGTWATLLASLAIEVPAALSGRNAGRLPVAGAFQPLTGRLVAAIVIACLTLTPRPAHPTPGLSVRPGGALAPRPAQALVVRDDAFTSRLMARTSPSLVSTAGMGTAGPAMTTGATPPSPTPVVAPRVYVVQRGDTLWGIAERELGDPLEWSTIYEMNEGRPQPGGVTLADPHWIDPGWTLLLPAASTTSPATPATSTTPAPAPTPPATGPSTTTPSSSPAASEPTTPTSTPPVSSPGDGRDAREHGARVASVPANAPVRLPSGSVVAGSFAAGVLSAVALGRLRRRHVYRYRPPEPGLDLSDGPLRPTLRLLARSAADRDDVAKDLATGTTSVRPTDTSAAATAGPGADRTALVAHGIKGSLRAGLLEVGVRDDRSVTVEVTDLSGVALSGPATDDIARALVAGLVVRAGPGAAELLCSTDLAERLVPGLGSDPAIRRAGTVLELARIVEVERVTRARRLDAAGARDAVGFWEEHPENPLPVLLVLVDAPKDESARRWAGLCEGAGRLGIAMVFLGDTGAGTGQVVTDGTRTVLSAEPERLARTLVGAELFALSAAEAVELLGSVFAASSDESDSTGADPADREGARGRSADGLAAVIPLGGTDEVPQQATQVALSWPAVVSGSEDRLRPIRVEILGPPLVTISGSVVSAGLRSRARMLLAWYLCRAGGASAGQAVDALWPDTPPEGVLRQFWRALGDLRAALRGPCGETPEVLEKIGEHYRAKPDEISCDLWDFQGALAEAGRTADDKTARQALRRAAELYRGDLLEGTDDLWVEPVRADLHRRAIDAQLRLAELDEHAGNIAGALEVVERAIELDRYAEEPYRRLMALYARCGRPDALRATWKLLRRRLAELDLDVEPATVNLYRSLAATEPSDAPRPVRPRS